MNENEDGLTPEELAALNSDDDIIDDGDPADPQDPPADPEEDPEDPADPEEPADPADPADPAPAEEPADPPADPAPAEPPVPAEAPVFVAEVPADAEAKLADIASKKEALITQFDDGDITAKEYQKELDGLMKEERQIELAVHEAQLASKMEQQRQQNEWTATVNGFITENPRYNPQTSPRMYQMLDMEVRAVASSDEFKSRTDSTAGRLILQRAHENLAKELGFEAKPAGQQPAAKEKAKPVPKPELPPSLHSAPAAEANDVTGGKYAVLDRLASTDPLAYEERLMKLSDAEREAYLSA